MTTDTTVIACDNVSKAYDQQGQQLPVLQGLNFHVEAGEKIAIVGSSGSGKTTLLNLLGGLDDPSSGGVSIMGKLIQPMDESQRAKWRNQHVGFVYQFHHLLGEFSALENVQIPLMIAKVANKQAKQRAAYLLERVGLAERLNHRPHELSGGERQRVAIARSLATTPSCVLMDEPTGNLDPSTSEKVMTLLMDLNKEFSTSFVIVTHDLDVASQLDRVLMLQQGQLLPYQANV